MLFLLFKVFLGLSFCLNSYYVNLVKCFFEVQKIIYPVFRH